MGSNGGANKGKRYNVAHVTDDRNEYMREYWKQYIKNRKKNIVVTRSNGELRKSDIPKEDRCDDFDELWNKIYRQVVYNWYEVKDISEIV